MIRSLKPLERWGRKTAAAVFSPVSRSDSRVLPPSPRRILVSRTDSRLGNLVMLEPLLRSLEERFPSAMVEVLASHVFAEIVELMGFNVIKADKKGQLRNPFEFAELVRRLRYDRYDVVIDAGHPHSFSLSGAVLAAISGACCTVSTDVGESAKWYTHLVKEPPADWHESRAIHHLGSLWGNWPAWTPPSLKPRRGVTVRNAIGVHVGASGGKKYPAAKMKKLVEVLSERHFVEIYWGNENEGREAFEIVSECNAAMMPNLTLEDLVEKIAGLKTFVTADNGPMHVAAALSIPVVAIFRVDDAHRFGPMSPGSRVLFDPAGPEPAKVAEAVFELL